MTDFALLYIICGLFVVIVAEFFYLMWVITEEKKEKQNLLNQLQAQNRALISKNAHDYVMTTSIDKVMTDEKEIAQQESDEIEETQLSDDDWYKAMGIKTPEQPAN